MAPSGALAALASRHGLPPSPYGLLLERCGVGDVAAWEAEGQHLLGLLAQLPGAASIRWGLWLPLFSRALQLLQRGERLVLGINGPIGAGKSTLMAAMALLAAEAQLPLAVASIDDLYLPWAQRQAVLAGNPFAVGRGPPGSHDVALLQQRLGDWRSGGELLLPRFDKRLRQGQGDRSGQWCGRPQLLLLEGWLLGCQPLPPARLAEAELPAAELPWLSVWNRNLEAYQSLWQELEGLWLLLPSDWQWPRRWRYQAEARQRRASPEGTSQTLSPLDLERLVRACTHSLPPELYQEPLACASRTEAVVVLDGQRRCLRSGPAFPAALDRQPDQASDSLSSSATG